MLLPPFSSIIKWLEPTPVTIISPTSGFGSSSATTRGLGKGSGDGGRGGERKGVGGWVCELLTDTIRGELLSLGPCFLVPSVGTHIVYLTCLELMDCPVGDFIS